MDVLKTTNVCRHVCTLEENLSRPDMKLNEERASYITCDAAARGASSFSFFLFAYLFFIRCLP